MRDAAVAAINFSLSLMKGLIRQQISRLPFKCQASIQRAASGIKAARVEQNGTIYNQSQKSHSSAQPGVASSGSLYCCGTRETLSQPLFDDFLSVAFARVCFHRQVSPQRHLPSPPPPPPLAFSSLSIQSCDALRSKNTPPPLVRILQNGRQGVLYFPQTVESQKVNICLLLE